jgi:hypothetical protein
LLDGANHVRAFEFDKIRIPPVAVQQQVIALCPVIVDQTAVNAIFAQKIPILTVINVFDF